MKESPPTVSVVIPAHNASAFLSNALESVFEQTFQDLEILVIDDGSTDSTAEVAESYGDRIRFFQQEWSGPARARNRGIAEAKGKYIAFLDADDRWLPTKLEKQVARIEADPRIGLVTTNHQGFNEEQVFPPGPSKGILLFGEENVARAIFLHSNIGTPTVLVPRSVLEVIGGFEEEIHIGEDDNLWIRIAASYPVELIEEVLVQVRLSPSSLTKDGDRFFADVGKNISWLCERYPTVLPLIEPAIPRKLSAYFAEFGCYLFRNERLVEARKALRTAIGYGPLTASAWRCFVLAHLPKSAIRFLRGMARRPFAC